MASAPACRNKLVLSVADHRLAGRIAAALEELIEPPADAVTTFEDAATSPPGWRVEAYYTSEPDTLEIAASLHELLGIATPGLALVEVPAENWVTVSQAALPPVTAGRFTVHGSHDRARVPRGPHSLLIDAGEAFGTAHHATTMGCLIAIDRLAHVQHYRRVLDLGCGSGVLAIAAQRCRPRARVIASDIDPIAVSVARANARINGATGIDTRVSDGIPRAACSGNGRYDLVIANILARPLIALAPAITASLETGGKLVLSGLLTSQARDVLGAYLPRGFARLRHLQIAGWSTLVLKKTQPIRRADRPA